MEGFSKIIYKGKKIYYIDYSSFGLNVDKASKLLRFATQEYERLQLPPKSVLAIVNLYGLHFNSELINAFSEEKEKTAYFEKKVAVIGINGLQLLGYNYITHLNSKDLIKIFKSIIDAKEWLLKD
jgi:CRISPR/Cas system-associated endonuclease Cas1